MTVSRAPLSLKIVAIILSVAALAVAKEFFIPIALALAFHALLRPLVRLLERIHLKPAAGGALVVLTMLGLMVAGGYALSGPVKEFMKTAPASIAKAREKLRAMGGPLQRVTDAAAGKDSTAAAAPAGAPPAQRPQAPPPQPPPPPPPPPAEAGAQAHTGPPVPSLARQLLGGASSFIALVVTVLVLVYLLLAAGDLVFRKFVKIVPGPDDKRTFADVYNETGAIVSRYVTMTALINTGQSIVVGLAMWAIGMPNPLMWGLLTFVLEFIPYLGGIAMVALLLMIGLTEFEGAKVLLAPAIYLVVSTLQNNVVSPYAYGNRLKLSPIAVMITVLFWWFIWGVPGAFLAIPIAATLKVLGDQVPRFSALSELLSE